MEETSVSGVPNFLLKLWKMLNQPESVGIISWTSSGKSFVIQDQISLITKLLPMYFKHNNMGSFIRQLNLYDFHKIYSDNNAQHEYHHKYFIKDHPELLKCITRKLSRCKKVGCSELDQEELSKLCKEIVSLKTRQEEMIQQVHLLRQENLSLWKEISNYHAIHNAQNQVLRKIIEILVSTTRKVDSERRLFEIDTTYANINSNASTVNDQLEITKNISDLVSFQESFNNALTLCNISNAENTQETTNGYIDLKELLVDVDNIDNIQGVVEDTSGEKAQETTPEVILRLDSENDLSTLLGNDVLECSLLLENVNSMEQSD